MKLLQKAEHLSMTEVWPVLIVRSEIFAKELVRHVQPRMWGLGQFGIHNNYISEIKLQQIDLPLPSDMRID